VDASASMAYQGTGPVSKLAYARLLAAAISHLLSRHGDAVGLVTFADALRDYIPSRAGRLHLRRILVALTKLDASGTTSCANGLRRAIDLLKRRGLLVLVSDLYDDGEGVESELRRAVRIGHEVAVFHVLSRDEMALPFKRDVELEDLETGGRVLTSAAVRNSYGVAVRRFLERWRTICASHGIDYQRVTTDMRLDSALADYLRRRTRSDRR